jgi:aspartate racemase
MSSKEIIGILGGMGPYATIEFMRNLLDITPVKKDWDHIRTVVDNNPHLPSRSRAILYNEESPLNGMIESCQKLQNYPVDLIVIPCNSASYWINDIRKEIHTPILSIIDATTITLSRYNSVDKVVVLGGMTTYLKELYKDKIESIGIKYINIDESTQNSIVKLIEKVKYGGDSNINKTQIEFSSLVSYIIARYNINGIVLGCTEFSFFKDFDYSVPIFDSSLELAHLVYRHVKK